MFSACLYGIEVEKRTECVLRNAISEIGTNVFWQTVIFQVPFRCFGLSSHELFNPHEIMVTLLVPVHYRPLGTGPGSNSS